MWMHRCTQQTRLPWDTQDTQVECDSKPRYAQVGYQSYFKVLELAVQTRFSCIKQESCLYLVPITRRILGIAIVTLLHVSTLWYDSMLIALWMFTSWNIWRVAGTRFATYRQLRLTLLWLTNGNCCLWHWMSQPACYPAISVVDQPTQSNSTIHFCLECYFECLAKVLIISRCNGLAECAMSETLFFVHVACFGYQVDI